MRYLDLYYLKAFKKIMDSTRHLPLQIAKPFGVLCKGKYLKVKVQNWILHPTTTTYVILIKLPNLFMFIPHICEMIDVGSYAYKTRREKDVLCAKMYDYHLYSKTLILQK